MSDVDASSNKCETIIPTILVIEAYYLPLSFIIPTII